MKILYATSEAVPFCKTGGLADVSGSLPPALAAEGAQIAVVLPLYRKVREQFGDKLDYLCFDYVTLGWRRSYCGLFRFIQDNVTYYFLDNEQYFNRPDLYGYMDDGERFAFFSHAVVRMLPHMAFWPDLIHCNDWQTALIPIYLKDDGVREDRYRSIRTVMTIHNVEYQGRYGKEILGDVFGLDQGWATDGTIIMDGDVNLLKASVLCADAVTTVSPAYAEELKYAYFAHGMESIMRRCGYKLSGVLNGIDTVRYDPATDPGIACNFSAKDLSGKAKDKAALQKALGLHEEPGTPIIGLVSRLVSHKGLDLVREVFHDIMELPVQLVLLGRGDKKYEDFFAWAQTQYPGRMAARLDYSEPLAMSIYAGADLFLMPSKSEPCGLSQMIAMRYGTVPIVRETGGLRDTVHAYEAWRDVGNGFTFAGYNSGDMLFVIRQAAGLYWDYPDQFHRIQQRCMAGDFSWKRSATEYLRIYNTVSGRPLREPAKEEPPAAKPEPEKPAAKPEPPKLTAKPERPKLTAKPERPKLAAKPEPPKLAEKAGTAKAAEKTPEKKTAEPAEKTPEKKTAEPAEKTPEKKTAKPVKKAAGKKAAPKKAAKPTVKKAAAKKSAAAESDTKKGTGAKKKSPAETEKE